MIRITVELVSAIDSSRDRLLGVGIIGNVGQTTWTGTDDVTIPSTARYCDYDVTLSKMQPQERETWRRGTVQVDGELADLYNARVIGFDREKRGCWDLIYLALRQLLRDRNPDPMPRRVRRVGGR